MDGSPKKRGSRRKSKKSPETEEQRQLRSEIKALREEESRKKKQEQIRAKLEAQIAEESRISRLNQLKIQEQWRKIMRMEKAAELKGDIVILGESHDRLAAQKDATIGRLEETLVEIEQQYQLALNSHTSNIDRLVKLQDIRIDALECEFDEELKEMETEFVKEREEIITKHKDEKEELLDIILAMEEEFNSADQEAKTRFQNARDEIKTRNAEEFGSLRMKLDGQILRLEKEFDHSHTTYTTNTEADITRLKQATGTDETNTRTIDANNRKLQRLQRNLNHWRTKMANNVRECEQRNKSLKEEKDNIQHHFQALKARMNKLREKFGVRLSELTKNTNSTIKSLESKLQLVERILALSEMNLKLETEKEKVMPFERADSDAIKQAEVDFESSEDKPAEITKQFQTCVVTKSYTPVGEWNYLDQFYKRYNKVMLDKMALDNEKAKLIKENQDLRVILQKYLDGVSVNAAVLNNPNPLLVINGKLSDSLPVRMSSSTSSPAATRTKQQVAQPQYVTINQYTR
ncbi:hypothetical protein PROFUN_15824 [Planoprotostelium fungivorum]|uniref:Dynein regulatory complex subunit 2 n=1 Tax=Planoprotostelium fungivorum TaxID=1890364 RepID=A0A2P6MUE6_9EUKA|nr:hypothetical protein PROFUN_15824 [Planoprotostelium fungivorum]